MKFIKTKIEDVIILVPQRFCDDRGFFSESWNKRALAAHGLDREWVQDNHSLSRQSGTVRGLHLQYPPHAQAKLVRCGRGALFDVAVDVRKGSPTFGQWVGVDLSFENGLQLFIPEGFLHGFATREPDTEIVYKCSDYYAADCDHSVAYDCPQIAVDWGLDVTNPIISEKDAKASGLADFDSPFQYQG